MPITIEFNPQLSQKVAPVDIATLINSLRSQGNPQSQKLAQALGQLQLAIYNLQQALKTPISIRGDVITLTDRSGAPGTAITPDYIDTKMEYRVNGFRVVTARQVNIPVVAGAAGAAYTAVEQGIMNAQTAAINAMLGLLQAHGLMA